MSPALLLAFLSGYISLSYEILWYRAYSFTSGGVAPAFGLLLGAYLLGLALGSLAVRRVCEGTDDAARSRQLRVLYYLTVASNTFGYAVIPLLAWLATKGASWKVTLPLVGLAAAGLGTVFPLVSHCWVEPDDRVGRRVSYLYLANILGSTVGSLLTGFVLLDHLSLGAAHILLAFLGLALATFVLLQDPEVRRLAVKDREAPRSVILLGLVILLGIVGTRPFEAIYEKLQYKGNYNPSLRFAHIVETKSGVITVNPEGQIFGGGIYDGAYNTSLHPDTNTILRCYAMMDVRPKLQDVLMIGLSSGSWATVVANNPDVERLTVIEINPGYLRLIPKFPSVAGLPSNPKVTIEIDDGRRWMVRNPERKFDAIIANATFNWRSNASNLLSQEFLELIRSRLKPGGFYFYNTTDSTRVAKTGCAVFPHAMKVGNFLAVSDAPFQMDYDRFRERLFDYPRDGKTVFDRSNPADREKAEATVRKLRTMIVPREEILRSLPADLRLITDDNMGTEWEGTP